MLVVTVEDPNAATVFITKDGRYLHEDISEVGGLIKYHEILGTVRKE